MFDVFNAKFGQANKVIYSHK